MILDNKYYQNIFVILHIFDLIFLLVTKNTSSQDKTDSGSIGAAVGGVVALLVLVSISVLFARKRKVDGKEEKMQAEDEGKNNYQFAKFVLHLVVSLFLTYDFITRNFLILRNSTPRPVTGCCAQRRTKTT